MNDLEIRALLLKLDDEQQKEAELNQSRAWYRLRDKLFPQTETDTAWSFQWVTGGALAGVALAVVSISFFAASPNATSPQAVAQAEQSGLYATSFYSPQAQADVVWISGLSSSTEEGNIP